MSQPKSADESGPVQKVRTSVYTVMLILSLLAIITGCVLLYLEMSQYGEYPYWKIPAGL